MISVKRLFGKNRKNIEPNTRRYELKLTLQEDEKFKELAAKLPPMQIVIGSIPQTIKGQPLYVDHHAEILCHYAKSGAKGVENYCAEVMAKQKAHPALKVVK